MSTKNNKEIELSKKKENSSIDNEDEDDDNTNEYITIKISNNAIPGIINKTEYKGKIYNYVVPKSATPGNTIQFLKSELKNVEKKVNNNKIQKVNSLLNFSNFRLKNIKNKINIGVNILSKSSVIVNIKDIIGNKNKPFDINYISYFKKKISIIHEIKELKKQKYINICMFYIEEFKKYPDKYLVYIYYNYKDLYFIYDNNESKTQLYDIGNLTNYDIKTLFNKNIDILEKINSHSLQEK